MYLVCVYKTSVMKTPIFFLSLVATAISVIVMSSFDKNLKTKEAPHGMVSFELARELPQSTAILSSWNAASKIAAGLSLGFDYFFMMAYTLFLSVSLIGVTDHLREQSLFRFRNVVLLFLVGAALMDAIENVALIRLLTGHMTQAMTSLAYYCASTKFILLVLGITYLCWALAVWLILRRNGAVVKRS